MVEPEGRKQIPKAKDPGSSPGPKRYPRERILLSIISTLKLKKGSPPSRHFRNLRETVVHNFMFLISFISLA